VQISRTSFQPDRKTLH